MAGAYAAEPPVSRGPALAPIAVQMYQPHLFGLWGQGFGNWGTSDSDHNAAKLSRDTGGFVIGADADLGDLAHGSGVWRLGVAGGYTNDSWSVTNRGSSGEFQSVFGAVYSSAAFGAVNLKTGVIATTTDTHTTRSIVFPGFSDVASSSYGGDEEQAFAELGYHLPFHGMLRSYLPGLESLHVDYEPFLQAAVIHLGQNRYAEASLTGAGLIGSSGSYDMGTTTLGLRSRYTLATLPGFSVSTTLRWRHGYGDVKPSVTQAFAASFTSFTVAGVPIARDALVAETSLDYAVSDRISLGIAYAGELAHRSTDNTIKGKAEIRF